jgi:hypothetical protein
VWWCAEDLIVSIWGGYATLCVPQAWLPMVTWPSLIDRPTVTKDTNDGVDLETHMRTASRYLTSEAAVNYRCYLQSVRRSIKKV